MSLFFTKLRIAPEIEAAPGWIAIVPDRGLNVAYQKDVVLWALADEYQSPAQEVAAEVVDAFNAQSERKLIERGATPTEPSLAQRGGEQ